MLIFRIPCFVYESCVAAIEPCVFSAWLRLRTFLLSGGGTIMAEQDTNEKRLCISKKVEVLPEKQKKEGKQMKKAIVLILTLIMLFAFASCGCEHEYDSGVIKKEATCTEKGIKTFKCKLCGKEEEQVIPCTSHKYDSGTIVKEATCKEEGIKVFRCVLCGNEEESTIPCSAHKYEEKVTQKATYYNSGKKTYTCAVCGYSYDEEIPKINCPVIIDVVGKTCIPKNPNQYRYSDFVSLIFDIENQGDNNIKGIEGILYVYDMFGNNFMSLTFNMTGFTLLANSSLKLDDWGR